MDPSVIVGGIGVVVTIISSFFSYRRGRRSEFAVAEWMREVRSWGRDVIRELTKAAYGIEDQKCEEQDKVLWSQNLSMLIEIGRFYFPNQYQSKKGVGKPAAYQGFRHVVLDPLVAAVRVLEDGTDPDVRDSDVLWELRREFVSILFNILSPDHHNKLIAQIIKESYRRNDPYIGGLLPKDGQVPPGKNYFLVKVIQRVRDRNSSFNI